MSASWAVSASQSMVFTNAAGGINLQLRAGRAGADLAITSTCKASNPLMRAE